MRLFFLSTTQKENGGQISEAPAAAEPSEKIAAASDNTASLGESLNLFEQDVTRIVHGLSTEILFVRDNAKRAGGRLNEVHGAMQTLITSSQQIDSEIGGIAQSTDELTAAATEIETTVLTVQERAASTLASADESTREIEGLGASVGEIGALLNSISEVASRTNLLALNATIEAARAGEAGKGFAVVAGEVKALSVAAGQAVSAIRAQMLLLQAASMASIDSMRKIRAEVGGLGPICDSISTSARGQRDTVDELSARMQVARGAVSEATAAIQAVGAMTDDALVISNQASAMSDRASNEANDLGRRVVTLLRSLPGADRRQFERFPIDLPVRIRTGAGTIACRTFDLSEGGLLIKPQADLKLAVEQRCDAEIAQIGTLSFRVVNVSPLGTHGRFEVLSETAKAGLAGVIDQFRRDHLPLVERAQAFAAEVAAAFESAMRGGRLTLASLFDTDYQRVPESDPVQYTTTYLPILEQILPPILERALALDPKLVFTVAIDRNAYLPVHNKKFCQPQRKDDVAWNQANSRNRRIFDDRAGLMAARVMSSYRIQSYHRDMGNGTRVPMKEIDAPITVAGRHWGGVRMAYSL